MEQNKAEVKKSKTEVKQSKTKKSKKTLWIVLGIVTVVIIALIVVVVAWFSKLVKEMGGIMGEGELAFIGEIEVVTEGTGVIEAAKVENVMIDYGSKVKVIHKENGEQVIAGDIIAEFESAILDESIQNLETQLSSVETELKYETKNAKKSVSAPVSGRVKQIYGEKDKTVLSVQNEAGALLELSADNRMKVIFETDAALAIGDLLTVKYEDESVDGIVDTIIGNQVTVTFEDSEKAALGINVKVFSGDNEVGNGEIFSNHPVMVTAENGTISNVLVEVNQKVDSGKTLFELKDVGYSDAYINLLKKREALKEKLAVAKQYQAGYQIVAATDGIVNNLTVKAGDSVMADTVFCEILNTDAYQLTADIDELDISGIETGQATKVTVDANSEKEYEGKVSKVSLAGNNENGVATYQVTMLLDSSENLLPGMTANAKIIVDMKTDALLVPLDAILTVDGEKQVNVIKEDGTFDTRTVTLGLVNNSYAEILDGIKEGEKVQLTVKMTDIYQQMGIVVE